jgi:peptidoglycan-associated lipoprotein
MKLVSIIAASILLAACETAPSSTGAGGGAGAGGSGATTAAGVTPGSQQDLVVNVGDRVFFDFNKSDLKPEARRTLERQAAWLKQYATVKVAIEGHCDERGTREYNLALGERRANAAKDYLVSLGIPAARLSTISYGKERPAVLGSNEAAWSQNRRGVTVVQ